MEQLNDTTIWQRGTLAGSTPFRLLVEQGHPFAGSIPHCCSSSLALTGEALGLRVGKQAQQRMTSPAREAWASLAVLTQVRNGPCLNYP